MNTYFAKAVGSTYIVLASIMLLFAAFTLWSIYKRLSLRFLRFMTWILILSNIIELAFGSLLIWYINNELDSVGQQDWWDSSLYNIFLAIFFLIHDLGMFWIIWFVTFKYWETSKQLARFFRSFQLKKELLSSNEHLGNSVQSQSFVESTGDSSIRNSTFKSMVKEHEKYRCYKWVGFTGVTLLGVARAVLTAYNESVQHNDNPGFYLGLAIGVFCCHLLILIFYFFALCMLTSSVRLLRRYFDDLSRLEANEKSFRLHFIMVAIFFFTNVALDIVLTIMFVKSVQEG